jgi:hypothetical protein
VFLYDVTLRYVDLCAAVAIDLLWMAAFFREHWLDIAKGVKKGATGEFASVDGPKQSHAMLHLEASENASVRILIPSRALCGVGPLYIVHTSAE